MRRRERLAFTITGLTGAALASCSGPAATPEKKAAPPALTEQWQRVTIGNSEMCPDRLACLVGLSGIDSPTIVSIKQVSFAQVRGAEACMPDAEGPGLSPDTASYESYAMALDFGVSPACPAFGDDRTSQQPYEDWRRSDKREYFEAQNKLNYIFLPLGSSQGKNGLHVRCVIVYNPSQGPAASMTAQAAAEICVTLFYFRERE